MLKINKDILTCGDIEIAKNKFCHYKSPTFLGDADIINGLVYNKVSSGAKNYKYFISYFYDDYKINSLHIMLPKNESVCKKL